ncbi:MAG: hypothetical protein ACI915_005284 [Gammaproteobacteria bacterium]|jgi:hypothetical protein
MTYRTIRTCRSIIAAAIIAGTLGVNGSHAATTKMASSSELKSVDANDIVVKADEIRFPSYAFQVDIDVTTIKQNTATGDVRKYRVLSKGNDRTLVNTVAPASEKGQFLLMRDKDLWVFLPRVSQPVRLPLSQKLTGQVANGDLARANFAGDYSATLLRRETIEEREFYVLELTAARRGVTYHRVIYWVDTSNYWPYKAEFYALSKRLLKTAHYGEYAELGGIIRPTVLSLQDAIGRKEKSLMVYSKMRARKLTDKIFTKQYLKKLK